MSERLGKIEKLEAERFKKGKKLYLVPLIYCGEEAPDEYKEKCSRYWQQATEQLANLASKIGNVNRIYHESVFQPGEDGMKAIERLNPGSYQIAKTLRDSGASVEAIEDEELSEEVMDWRRCLMLGFISQKVAAKVSGFYVEAAKMRNEVMARKIAETLEDDEAGLLFVQDGHSVQFPADIEVFSIFPPALDDIHRWLREQSGPGVMKAPDKSKEETEPATKDAERKTRKRARRKPEA
ncbi:MAG: hypothetical protein IBX67_08225 [Dehalococcoidia bacterium]|nr:hypothetical protein [Dehalococcoidia bacterium]